MRHFDYPMLRLLRRSYLLALALPLVACSGGDDAGEGIVGNGGNGSGATGTGGFAAAGTGSGGIIIGTGGASGTSGASSGGTGGDGTPEVCDGVDNDSNGQIDDVDAGNDGVCDCLNIGTIGHIGPWSNGGDIFATWLNARSPQGAVVLADQVLTPELLAPLQVIVVLHVDTEGVSSNGVTAPAHHAFSPAEADAFRAWVENGGGVMTTIGYMNDESREVINVNRLLSTVGMGYSATNIDLTGFVASWDAHPVTMGVRSIFTDNGVEPEGTGTTVARGADNRVALQVTQAANGRVVVWGDEWITYDSEWADVQDQQVELFWLNILKWLSPPGECQVPIPPGIVR